MHMRIEIEKQVTSLERKMLSPFASFGAKTILCIKLLVSGYMGILPLQIPIFLIDLF